MKTVNKIKPAYTYYLEKNMKQIEAASKNTKDYLVEAIKTIVSPAAATYVNKYGTKLPTKKKLFLKRIKYMETEQIMKYVRNSVNKAKETKAKYNNLKPEV